MIYSGTRFLSGIWIVMASVGLLSLPLQGQDPGQQSIEDQESIQDPDVISYSSPVFSGFVAGDVVKNGAGLVVTSPTEAPIYDFNHDGDLTQDDEDLLIAHDGATGSGVGPYDLDNSGTVDSGDVTVYQAYEVQWDAYQNGGTEPDLHIEESDGIFSIYAYDRRGLDIDTLVVVLDGVTIPNTDARLHHPIQKQTTSGTLLGFSTVYLQPTPFSPGVHTVTFTVTNTSGATKTVKKTFTIAQRYAPYIDNKAPFGTIDRTPDISADFHAIYGTISAADCFVHIDGPEGYHVELTGGQVSASGFTFTPGSDLDFGVYTVQCFLEDSAGVTNWFTDAQGDKHSGAKWDFAVRPEVNFALPNPYAQSGGTLTFVQDFGTDPDNEYGSNPQVWINGQLLPPAASEFEGSDLVVDLSLSGLSLAEGQHSITVQAETMTLPAVEDSQVFDFWIDNTPPQISSVNPSVPNYLVQGSAINGAFNDNLSGIGEDGVAIDIDLEHYTSAHGVTVVPGTSGVFSYAPESPTAHLHTFRITVTDRAGNAAVYDSLFRGFEFAQGLPPGYELAMTPFGENSAIYTGCNDGGSSLTSFLKVGGFHATVMFAASSDSPADYATTITNLTADFTDPGNYTMLNGPLISRNPVNFIMLQPEENSGGEETTFDYWADVKTQWSMTEVDPAVIAPFANKDALSGFRYQVVDRLGVSFYNIRQTQDLRLYVVSMDDVESIDTSTPKAFYDWIESKIDGANPLDGIRPLPRQGFHFREDFSQQVGQKHVFHIDPHFFDYQATHRNFIVLKTSDSMEVVAALDDLKAFHDLAEATPGPDFHLMPEGTTDRSAPFPLDPPGWIYHIEEEYQAGDCVYEDLFTVNGLIDGSAVEETFLYGSKVLTNRDVPQYLATEDTHHGMLRYAIGFGSDKNALISQVAADAATANVSLSDGGVAGVNGAVKENSPGNYYVALTHYRSFVSLDQSLVLNELNKPGAVIHYYQYDNLLNATWEAPGGWVGPWNSDLAYSTEYRTQAPNNSRVYLVNDIPSGATPEEQWQSLMTMATNDGTLLARERVLIDPNLNENGEYMWRYTIPLGDLDVSPTGVNTLVWVSLSGVEADNLLYLQNFDNVTQGLIPEKQENFWQGTIWNPDYLHVTTHRLVAPSIEINNPEDQSSFALGDVTNYTFTVTDGLTSGPYTMTASYETVGNAPIVENLAPTTAGMYTLPLPGQLDVGTVRMSLVVTDNNTQATMTDVVSYRITSDAAVQSYYWPMDVLNGSGTPEANGGPDLQVGSGVLVPHAIGATGGNAIDLPEVDSASANISLGGGDAVAMACWMYVDPNQISKIVSFSATTTNNPNFSVAPYSDINGDGLPEVVYIFEDNVSRKLRLANGLDGSPLWSVTPGISSFSGEDNIAVLSSIDGDVTADIATRGGAGVGIKFLSGVDGSHIKTFNVPGVNSRPYKMVGLSNIEGITTDAVLCFELNNNVLHLVDPNTETSVSLDSGAQFRGLASLPDLDGQGFNEFVYGNNTTGECVIRRGETGHSVLATIPPAVSGLKPRRAKMIGDLNGDGVEELAVGYIRGGQSHIDIFDISNPLSITTIHNLYLIDGGYALFSFDGVGDFDCDMTPDFGWATRVTGDTGGDFHLLSGLSPFSVIHSEFYSASGTSSFYIESLRLGATWANSHFYYADAIVNADIWLQRHNHLLASLQDEFGNGLVHLGYNERFDAVQLSTPWGQVSSSTGLSTGWHHVACQVDSASDELTLWIDGTPVSRPLPFDVPTLPASSRFTMAAGNHVTLDDVAIWSTTIDNNLVQYLQSNPLSGGLAQSVYVDVGPAPGNYINEAPSIFMLLDGNSSAFDPDLFEITVNSTVYESVDLTINYFGNNTIVSRDSYFDGNLTIGFSATDVLGYNHLDSTTAFVDFYPPQIVDTDGVDGSYTNNPNRSYTFGISDAGSGVDTGSIQVTSSVGNVTNIQFISGVLTFTLDSVPEGPYTITIQAADNNAHTTGPVAFNLTSDLTPPSLTNLIPAQSSQVDRNDPIGSGITDVAFDPTIPGSYLVTIDSGINLSWNNPNFSIDPTSWSYPDLGVLSQGQHTLYISFRDAAGNWLHHNSTFTIIGLQKTIQSTNPMDQTITNVDPVQYTAVVPTGPSYEDLNLPQCKLIINGNDQGSTFTQSGLDVLIEMGQDGVYTVEYYIIDVFDRIDTVTNNFTLDATDPIVTPSNFSDGNGIIVGNPLEWSASDNLTGIDHVDIDYGSGTVQLSDLGGGVYRLDTTGFAQQVYSYTVTAFDAAGNTAQHMGSFEIVSGYTPPPDDPDTGTGSLPTLDPPGSGNGSNNLSHGIGEQQYIGYGVNANSGQFVHTQTLLSRNGRGLDFELVGTYRSQVDRVTPLGHGWDLNYFMKLAPSGNDYHFHAGNGRVELFEDASGEFVSLQLPWKLTESPLKLETPSGTTYNFDSGNNGRLTSIVDRNGNTITCNYTGADLTSITDTLGVVTNLEYRNGYLYRVYESLPFETNFSRFVTLDVADNVSADASSGDLVGISAPHYQVPLGAKALIYYGNNGLPPQGAGVSGNYDDLKQIWEQQGHTVDYTDQWPADLSDHTTIVLVAPGIFGEVSFDSTQKAQLNTFLADGGRLVVVGDNSTVLGAATIQDLLTDLDIEIVKNNDDINAFVTTDWIQNDFLTVGVNQVFMARMSTLGFQDGLNNDYPVKGLVIYQGDPIISVQRHRDSDGRPGGEVVVIGDVQILDDRSISTTDSDNDKLAANLLNNGFDKDAHGTRFTYSTGLGGALDHNLLTIRNRNKLQYVGNTYDSSDRVGDQLYGAGHYNFSYSAVQTIKNIGDMSELAVSRTICNDRNGYLSEYWMNAVGNCVAMTVYGNAAANANGTSTPGSNWATEVVSPSETGETYTTLKAYSGGPRSPGILKRVVKPLGGQIDYTYAFTNPAHHPWTGTDRRGEHNLVQKDMVADSRGGNGNYTYDAYTTIQEIWAYSASAVTNGVFDVVATYTDPKTKVTTYGYDVNGNMTSMQLPSVVTASAMPGEDTGLTWTYTYNTAGNPANHDNGLLDVSTDPNGLDTKHSYGSTAGSNEYGRLTTVQIGFGDPKEITNEYEYNLAGDVTIFTDGNQGCWKTSHNPRRAVVHSQTAIGFTTIYIRDGEDNVVSVFDPDNHEIVNTYNNLNSIETKSEHLVDGDSNTESVTVFVRDSADNVIRTESGEGSISLNKYNTRYMVYESRKGFGQPGHIFMPRATLYDDAPDSITSFEFDKNGNLVKTVLPNDGTARDTQCVYDGFDRKKTAIDPNAGETRIVLDQEGLVLSQSKWGELEVGGSGGTLTRLSQSDFTYNDADRMFEQKDYHFDPSTQTNIGDGLRTTTTRYHRNGQVGEVENDNSHVAKTFYDALRRVDYTEDPVGNKRTFTYDDNNNVTQIDVLDIDQGAVGNENYQIIKQYDSDNRVQVETNPDGNLGTAIEYDYGNRNQLLTVRDQKGNPTHYAYDDALNKIAEVKALNQQPRFLVDFDTLGTANQILNKFEYNFDFMLIAEIDDNNNRTDYKYNDRRERIEVKHADNAPNVITTNYSVLGVPSSMTDQNGSTTTYTYNKLILKSGYSATLGTGVLGTTAGSFKYRGDGLMIEASDEDSDVFEEYDSLAMLSKSREGKVGVRALVDTVYTRDNVGNVTTVVYPSSTTGAAYAQTINQTFDVNERMTGRTESLQSTSYARDFVGYRVRGVNYNGTPYVKVNDAKAAFVQLLKSGQERWRVNRDVAYRTTDEGFLNYNNVTNYDGANRETRKQYAVSDANLASALGGTDVADSLQQDNGFDGANNKISTTINGGVADTPVFLNANEVDYHYEWEPNSGSNYGQVNYTYDNNGNVKQKFFTGTSLTLSYDYDVFNRLVRFNDGTTTYTYEYDAKGRRSAKSFGGTVERYVHEGHRIIQMRGNGASWGQVDLALYYLNGVVQYADINNGSGYTRNYAVTDHQGTVREWTNASGVAIPGSGSGVIAGTWNEYGPYGVHQTHGGTQFTTTTNPLLALNDIPLGYQGMWLDAESGTYNTLYRQYDPYTGRWLQRDPVLFGEWSRNLYGGMGASWGTLVDPLGDDSDTDWGILEPIDELMESGWYWTFRTLDRLGESLTDLGGQVVEGYTELGKYSTDTDYRSDVNQGARILSGQAMKLYQSYQKMTPQEQLRVRQEALRMMQRAGMDAYQFYKDNPDQLTADIILELGLGGAIKSARTASKAAKLADDLPLPDIKPDASPHVVPDAPELRIGSYSAIPESYIDLENAVNMNMAPPGSKLNAAGFKRNGPWFWRQLAKTNPSMFSKSNLALIKAGRSPIVDDVWIKNNPSHEAYKGQKLVHHHVGQGNMAVPLPEKVHRDYDAQLHPVQK